MHLVRSIKRVIGHSLMHAVVVVAVIAVAGVAKSASAPTSARSQAPEASRAAAAPDDPKGIVPTVTMAATPTSGITFGNMDPTVRAQDDMFNYMNGKWLATTEIPSDQSSWGTYPQLREEIQPKLRTIIEVASADKTKKSEEQRIVDFYASYMDEAKIEALGVAPVKAELLRVASVTDKRELASLIAYFNRSGYIAPYRVVVRLDARDSRRYSVTLLQSGLSLPDPDYYLVKSDPQMVRTLIEYEHHIARMLALAGNPHAASEAKSVVGLETELAKIQWTKVQLRDPLKAYNKMAPGDLSSLTTGFDWTLWMQDAGLAGKVDYVIVGQPSYFSGLSRLLRTTPLTTWKAYFQWQVLHANAPYLSKAFAHEDFTFFGASLTVVKAQQPRWRLALAATNDALSDLLGKLYVERYFPPERKARVDALVKNLLEAYKQSIDMLDWMSPATKEQAQIKLSKLATHIAYPNRWRDYSELTVVKDDLVGNVRRANAFDLDSKIGKLGKPVDRDEWNMSPQTVNCYYFSPLNEIVFPAAMLQPPFFNAEADDAVNYGAIGAVIGHEISHGFDDQGSQYDGDGNLRDWWTKIDRDRFAAKAAVLVKQYNSFSPVKGYFVNGELTLGENIADNSGAAIAYKAYLISLRGRAAPVIDGLTGPQRFYMGFGQLWRAKTRDAQQVVYLKSDPHAPEQFRVNGTLSNQPGFYEAFGVKPGDKMYVEPAQRVIIW